MTIDLRTCRKGDPLKLRNGLAATYDECVLGGTKLSASR